MSSAVGPLLTLGILAVGGYYAYQTMNAPVKKQVGGYWAHPWADGFKADGLKADGPKANHDGPKTIKAPQGGDMDLLYSNLWKQTRPPWEH
jgi:hypothetical protein